MGNSQCKAVCIQDKSGASFNNVKKNEKNYPARKFLYQKNTWANWKSSHLQM